MTGESDRPRRRIADSRIVSFLRRHWQWLPWLLVVCPSVVLALLIKEHAVNAPFLDDFMNVPLFAKVAKQPLEWHDYFAAQMEHRIAFTRLVFVFFNHFWPTDYLKQIWCIWLLFCLTLVNLTLLLRRSDGMTWRRTWPVAALASLCLFSPVQYHVVLWPFMHQVACLMFFFTLTMVVWQTNWPVALRFCLALVCVMCATLSFSSGILFWLLLLPVMWWCAPMSSVRVRWLVCGLWLAIFAVTMACYFHDLKNGVDPEFSIGQGNNETMGRNIREFLDDPWKSIGYALRLQGGFLARGAQEDLLKISLTFGAVMMGTYTACALYWLWRFRDVDLRRRMLPWLLMGLYGIGTMFAITLGRGWLTRTGSTALSGRYTIHAMTLAMVLPVLVWMLAQDLANRIPAAKRFIRDALLVGGTVLLCVEINSWHYGSRMMEAWQSARMRAATNTLFYKTGCPIEYDYAGVPRLAKLADDLDILRPAMLKNNRLDNFRVRPHPLHESFANWASLTIVHREDGITAVAVGSAIFKQYARVPDAIFLTWFDPGDQHWEIFRVTQVTGMPLYLEGMFSYDIEFVFPPDNGVRENLSEFTSSFKLQELPKGVHKLAAWAYDYQTRSVTLIPGSYEVDTEKAVVKSLGPDADAIDLSGYVRQQLAKGHHL